MGNLVIPRGEDCFAETPFHQKEGLLGVNPNIENFAIFKSNCVPDPGVIVSSFTVQPQKGKELIMMPGENYL